jgi:hypothetical protein
MLWFSLHTEIIILFGSKLSHTAVLRAKKNQEEMPLHWELSAQRCSRRCVRDFRRAAE